VNTASIRCVERARASSEATANSGVPAKPSLNEEGYVLKA
jgi:hypothetical protein